MKIIKILIEKKLFVFMKNKFQLSDITEILSTQWTRFYIKITQIFVQVEWLGQRIKSNYKNKLLTRLGTTKRDMLVYQ